MYFITEIQKAHEKRIGCCDKKEAAYPQPLKLPCRKEEQQGLYFPGKSRDYFFGTKSP